MSTLSIADRLLGSIVGTYIGHGYGNRQWTCIQTKDSPLYQSWLQAIQQDPPPGPKALDFSAAIALPWLLYHHDHRRTRHNWIAQTVETSITTSRAPDILYYLGDSLEWLIQCRQKVPHPLPLLCEHLQHQRPHYPPAVSGQANQLIELLLAAEYPPAAAATATPYDPHITLGTVALALRQCLTDPENLALALAGTPQYQPSPTLIGCFSGAWGGTAIIPKQWLRSLSSESRHDLHHMSQHLYRHWAGISSMAGTFETFPLEDI